MRVFFSVYFGIMMAAPPVARAILDASGSPAGPIFFGMALFAAVLPAVFAFRWFKSESATPAIKEA